MSGMGIRVLPLVAVFACGGQQGTSDPETALAELADPKACAECHPDHYREWSGSMHAYAAEDPVFLAMNQRGQRETDGELGDFCINCHAPLAVQLGLTTDGLNLDEVPDQYKGVTCYFCHQVDAVDGTHNNPLRLAWDNVMRGGIADPAKSEFHRTAWSPLHDRDALGSADMCGSCHDIVNPGGVHIERTYSEWQGSLFANDAIFKLTCAECHMRGRDGIAADAPGVKLRRVHDHSMVGVDIAVTPFPEREEQLAKVQDALDTTLLASLCIGLEGTSTLVSAQVENVGAGHNVPSGAAADRRLWAEIVAYDGDEVLWSTGVVGEEEAVAKLEDPNLWLFRDVLRKESGEEAHMFWEAASYETHLLPAATASDPADPAYIPTHENRLFTFDAGRVPTRVTMRMQMRPIGLDVLDDLIASGDLDPALRDEFPTFELQTTVLEWTPETGVENGDLSCAPN